MYRAVARNPANHDMYLTAMFSALNAAQEVEEEDHAWLVQMRCDDAEIERLDEYAWLVLHLLADPALPFRALGCEVSQQFMSADVRPIRAQAFSVRVAPLGCGQAISGGPALVPGRADLLLVCGQVSDDGSVCNHDAESATSLSLHQARAKNTTVPVVSYVSDARCPWRRSLFAPRESACRHVLWAYKRGGCPTDRAHQAERFYPRKDRGNAHHAQRFLRTT